MRAILLLLVLFIIAIGCTSTVETDLVQADNDLTPDKAINSAQDATEEELSACREETNDKVKRKCNRYLALKTHNSIYCIKDDFICLSTLAELIKDETLCEKLPEGNFPTSSVSEKDLCIMTVASKATDIEICEKISQESVIVQCKQLLNQVLDCETAQNKEACYAQQAISEFDANKCEEIEDPTVNKACKNQVRYASAVFNNDITKCNLISDINLENKCIGELAVLNDDTGICLKSSEGYQNLCLFTFARSRLSLKACDEIDIRAGVTKLQAQQAKDQCFVSLAQGRTFGDEPCEMVVDPKKRESCFDFSKLFEE